MLHQKITDIIRTKLVQFIVLVSIVIFVSFIAYGEYNRTMKETTNKLNEKVINFHFETFAHLSKVFLKDSNHNFVKSVITDGELVDKFEEMLGLVRTTTIENLFVITKDSEENYYFLLDSEENLTIKSGLFEPFNPLGDFWDKSYEFNTPQVYHHKESKELWISIAYPIIENNSTVAIIGADISHKLDITMQMKLQDFTTFFFWMFLLNTLWFVMLYVLTLYFRTKFHEGYLDPLTKVYNRKYLYDIIVNKLARKYQLFMIDIDFFKKVNDTYGHDTGDYVLQEVANRMKALTRDEDFLIRYGGEEFLIYTTMESSEQCELFAQRIRRSIEKEYIEYKNIVCPVTISIGINPNATEKDNFNEMIKKADEALYEAKLSGRNCVKIAK